MNNDMAEKIWKQYEDGINYFDRVGLSKEWDECEKFVEGNHWPRATPKTKNLPRPVVNLCSMIAENKKASILSEHLKLNFTPAEMFGEKLMMAQQGANIFTKYADKCLNEMKIEEKNDTAMDYATQLGTYIYHFFWDSDVVGGMTTPYVGAMRVEILHPKNVVLSNMREKDIQKQRYIILASIEELESVKKLAKENGVFDWQNIKADHEIDDEATKDKEVCTVLTKYSRINGKVVWSKSTKEVMLQEPTYWEPDLNSDKIKLYDENDEEKEETIETSEPDKPLKEFTDGHFQKQLYPIVFETHKERKQSAYGIGEVAQAIPNNKAVNFNLAMMLLSIQQTAWPKIMQKPNALGRQSITNAPGEILTDNSQGNGWGITYLTTPGFNNQAMNLNQVLIDLTRMFTGSTEVTTGEAIGSNMAASAIIALQNQAKKPVEIFQKKFFRVYERIGKILEQFFKFYYTDDRAFSYEENGNNIVAQMNGEIYKNIDYSLNVNAGPGGTYSESLEVSLLDTMKANGDIDTDTYIDLYPDDIMPFKTELKKARLRMQQEQLQREQAMLLGGMIPNETGQTPAIPPPSAGEAAIQPSASDLLAMQGKVSPQQVARATE